MSIEARKLGLINGITRIDEEEVLMKIERLRQEENWFEDLPEEIRDAVMESKAQGDNGSYVDQRIQEKKIRDLL